MAGPAGTLGAETAAATGSAAESGAGARSGVLAHAPSAPRIAASQARRPRRRDEIYMWVILLEAFGALVLFVLIVWWTMFSGRDKGERRDIDQP